jgi:hypothetical protein
MEKFNFNFFLERVGQKVKVADVDKTQEFEGEISKVIEGKMRSDEWESYCVVVNKDPHVVMQDTNYLISHIDWGTETIFCSPKSETTFEFIFSRRV